jgi:hypothetical protein
MDKLELSIRPVSMRGPILSKLAIPENDKDQRSVNETIQWDPAIVETGPIVKQQQSASINVLEPLSKDIDLIGSGDADVCALVQTLKSLNKLGKHERLVLMRALRNVIEDKMETVSTKKVSDSPTKEFGAVKGRSTMNPGVPGFKSSTVRRSSEVSLKENNPPVLMPYPSSAKPLQASKSASSHPPRQRVMCDDPNAFGREVDSFESWYADQQLATFMKKYPLTGKKAGETAKKPPAKKRVVLPSTVGGPVEVRHAAAIQQRLEFLLFKDKEKKALERRKNSFRNLQDGSCYKTEEE